MIKNWCKDTHILLKSLYLVFGRHYLYGRFRIGTQSEYVVLTIEKRKKNTG